MHCESHLPVSLKYLQLVYSDKTWLRTLLTSNSNTKESFPFILPAVMKMLQVLSNPHTAE